MRAHFKTAFYASKVPIGSHLGTKSLKTQPFMERVVRIANDYERIAPHDRFGVLVLKDLGELPRRENANSLCL